ncbi:MULTISPECIES: hypothetical protein [Rhodanobacter]|uniref:hypothetical protein n=1 Tax=Rhodanobacter TaxID=75309 RepID=UPI0003FA1D10|nr:MULTISPECIES: hypothetical protein [Rhodanobacter]KZC18825.1 hypothetical protein RHOFW104R3_34430 [Rhodanobacter denitrificans]UJJ51239.1 hypothetical protein LRK52_00680 [Rhodanobacter denitrificans]UJM93986.1 hypothetical protein LRK32_00685 [Rhodanobacter denitrificans]UJM97515.1 hypothetical protein LRK44_00685 [Rhodanobacter denitrificans]UJN23070.1 hypothetical protein LRK54_07810 [Rhodanobacter denitrificans]
MFRWIKNVWTGSEPVEFVSAFGMNESVERLRAATRRWSFPFATQECAAGTVKENRVSLQRVIPMVGNSFKPFFIGRFEQRQGKVVLRGRFTMMLLVKVFMAFWLGMLALFAVAGSAAAVASPKAAMFPLAAVGMMGFGVGLTALGQWFSRNDAAWLTHVMRTALQVLPDTATPGQGAGLAGQAASGKTPVFIYTLTGLFTLFGLLGIMSAISGIQIYRGGPDGAVITHYANDTLRMVAGAGSIAMLGVALGIYRRMLFAWWSGFVLLAASTVYSIVSPLVRTDLGDARVPAVVFGGISVVIGVFWGRWWHAQRHHFHD